MAEKLKKYCGRCPHLDLGKPSKRYMDTYYPCDEYERHYRAHDVCIEVPVTITKEEVKLVKEIIKKAGKKKKKEKKVIPPPKEMEIIEVPADLTKEQVEQIEEKIKEIPIKEAEFVPPDPIEEIIELTPEEKKAIKRQQLEAQIAELEAEE